MVPTGESFWKALVVPGACWTLPNFNSNKPNTDDVIIVENYDARRVGDAEVAKLRFTRVSPGNEVNVSDKEHLPGQIAVTKAGVWFFDRKLDDQTIGREMKKPPTHAERPRDLAPSKAGKWQFVRNARTAKGPIACIGHEQPRAGGGCEDTCEGMVCFSSTAGVVLLEGTASPNFERFMQPGWDITP